MGRRTDEGGDTIADAAETDHRDQRQFSHDDGSVYERVDPDEFEQVIEHSGWMGISDGQTPRAD